MRPRSAMLLLTAAIMAVTMSGCSKNSGSETVKIYGDAKAFEEEFKGVNDAEKGPLLSISNTKVKAGETAEVTVSVSGSEEKWSVCGIHVAFPDVLRCVLSDDEERDAKYKKGDALDDSLATFAKLWRDNLSETLANEKKYSVFFTTMFEDGGSDGDIITFYFDVPASAQPGTVYDIEFYYSCTDQVMDMFRSSDNDRAYEKYAFTHWKNGTITVE